MIRNILRKEIYTMENNVETDVKISFDYKVEFSLTPWDKGRPIPKGDYHVNYSLLSGDIAEKIFISRFMRTPTEKELIEFLEIEIKKEYETSLKNIINSFSKINC